MELLLNPAFLVSTVTMAVSGLGAFYALRGEVKSLKNEMEAYEKYQKAHCDGCEDKFRFINERIDRQILKTEAIESKILDKLTKLEVATAEIAATLKAKSD